MNIQHEFYYALSDLNKLYSESGHLLVSYMRQNKLFAHKTNRTDRQCLVFLRVAHIQILGSPDFEYRTITIFFHTFEVVSSHGSSGDLCRTMRDRS